MEAEQNGKKRRKINPSSNVAPLACTNCNRRHIKCDGKLPCKSCISSSLECVFPQTVKKRGPQPGEKKQLEALVKDMATELAALREQRDYWQQRAVYLESMYGNMSSSSSTEGQESFLQAVVPLIAATQSPRAEIGLSLSIDISEFLRAFEQTAAPMVGMMPPAFDHFTFSNSIPTGSNLQLLAMISTGARALGRSDIAEEYFQKAITMSNSLFGSVSADVASAFNLMSLLFIVSGVESEALLYANTSNRMLGTLIQSPPQQESQLVQLKQQYLLSRITQAEGHVTNMPHQHDLFVNLLTELGGSPSDSDPTISIQAMAILAKTRAWITVNGASLDQNKLLAQLASQLALLQRAENMYLSALRHSGASASQFAGFHARLRTFIGSMRAALYASAGLTEIAVGMSESLLEELRESPSQPFLIGIDSIFAATSLAEAMLRCGRLVEFGECCALLSRYASGFPIASMIVDQLKAAIPQPTEAFTDSSSPTSSADFDFSAQSPDSVSGHTLGDVVSELQQIIGDVDAVDESQPPPDLTSEALASSDYFDFR
eukprot:TRINITY_DN1495_c0_g1_i1.p1 TRINITY_DN1495_c0_g1~~TRINITY_DN1495_c0_g1_i1.p1  ORF type:complete len:547 (-),score=99.46 TRINITY_DN1495_c0_g1_i1:377-2017(-)